eukprot:COSAG02_NODE_27576_length_606_cov_1.471400_1_plen_61_part_00
MLIAHIILRRSGVSRRSSSTLGGVLTARGTENSGKFNVRMYNTVDQDVGLLIFFHTERPT